jgi:hypothetical protein
MRTEVVHMKETQEPEQLDRVADSRDVLLARQLETRWRFRIVAIIAPTAVALVLLLVKISVPFEEMRFGFRDDSPMFRLLYSVFSPTSFSLLFGTLLLTGLAGLVMFYLQTGFRRDNDPALRRLRAEMALGRNPSVAEDAKNLDSRMSVVEHELRTLTTAAKPAALVLGDEELRRLTAEVTGRVGDLAADEIIAKARRKLEYDRFTITTEQTLERLSRELEALSFRGNLNLTLGVVITVAGIGFLVFFVIFRQPPPDRAVPWVGLLLFAPRLSLVLVIELFAYFFLNLYKSTLAEIKFFQNEMTNVESRSLALLAAQLAQDASTSSSVIGKLADTDRNFLQRPDHRDPQPPESKAMLEFTKKVL